MKTIEEMGALFLGTRLKRLSDTLYDEVDRIYNAKNIQLRSRWTSVLFLLFENGDSAITQIAENMGLTHPAISQMSRKLMESGYIESKPDEQDERRRLLGLTEAGQQLVEELKPIWEHMRITLDERINACNDNLLNAVTNLERSNLESPIGQEIIQRSQLNNADQVNIIPYEKRYANDFKQLNISWLEKFFYVEEIDDLVLSKPKKYILNNGGIILFAKYQKHIVGTCALMLDNHEEVAANPNADKRFELTKMAVTEEYQGLKIGRKLMVAAIAEFKKLGGNTLFLESNSRLKPALHLYESMGFVHKEKPSDSHYSRADVYMEYDMNFETNCDND